MNSKQAIYIILLPIVAIGYTIGVTLRWTGNKLENYTADTFNNMIKEIKNPIKPKYPHKADH